MPFYNTAPLIINPYQLKEGRDYLILNGKYFLKTRVAAELLNVKLVTLNKDCRLAYDYNTGNLAGCQEYIRCIHKNGLRTWWVRNDINQVYFMKAPGKGRNNTLFPVASLVRQEE